MSLKKIGDRKNMKQKNQNKQLEKQAKEAYTKLEKLNNRLSESTYILLSAQD